VAPVFNYDLEEKNFSKSSRKLDLSNSAKQASVSTMTSSFDANLFPLFGNRRKSPKGLNLENTVDVAAIRSPIPPISLRQRGIGVQARCLGGRAPSFSPSEAVFSSMPRQICPIIEHNTAL
jgi:hypothetical protein